MSIRSILTKEGLVAAKKAPSAWDPEGTKAELNKIPGAEVKFIKKDAFGYVPYLRLIVPGIKNVIEVYEVSSFPSTTVMVTTTHINGSLPKNVPPEMEIKGAIATPQAVKGTVEKWIDAYLKLHSTSASSGPREPSVQRVLDNVYYGRPLPK